MQDRLWAVSSIGAAMVLVGVLQLVLRHLRVAGLVATVVLVVVPPPGSSVSPAVVGHRRRGRDRRPPLQAAIADPSADEPLDVTVARTP